jgi:hypothetical protein
MAVFAAAWLAINLWTARQLVMEPGFLLWLWLQPATIAAFVAYATGCAIGMRLARPWSREPAAGSHPTTH